MYQKTAWQGFVSGGKGQGKTTLTDALMKPYKRVFAFDPNGEYAAKGYTTFLSLHLVIDYLKKNKKRGYKIAYVPAFKGMTAQLDKFCEIICTSQLAYFNTPDLGPVPPIPKVALIVDEMRWSYPQHASCPWLEMIATRGRHYGVDAIGTTVRFAEVSTSFRGVCDLQFFFAQHDATDLRTAGGMIGKQNIPALRALKPHEFLRVFRGVVTRGKNSLKR